MVTPLRTENRWRLNNFIQLRGDPTIKVEMPLPDFITEYGRDLWVTFIYHGYTLHSARLGNFSFIYEGKLFNVTNIIYYYSDKSIELELQEDWKDSRNPVVLARLVHIIRSIFSDVDVVENTKKRKKRKRIMRIFNK